MHPTRATNSPAPRHDPKPRAVPASRAHPVAPGTKTLAMTVAWPVDRAVADGLRHAVGQAHGHDQRDRAGTNTVGAGTASERSHNRPSLQLRCELTFAQPDTPEIAHAGVRVVLVLIGPAAQGRVRGAVPTDTILTAADTSDASVIRRDDATTIEIPGLLTAVFRAGDDALAYIHTGLLAELGIPGGRCGVPAGSLREGA